MKIGRKTTGAVLGWIVAIFGVGLETVLKK